MLGAPEMVAPALRAGPDWRAQADAWAARGLRVVLFAGRPEPVAFSDGDRPPELPDGLEALGLVCFSDELRPGVQKTLDEFTEAGIEVKIISGDNPRTVTALATQAGVHAVRRPDDASAYCEAAFAADGGATAAAAGPGGGRRDAAGAPTPPRSSPSPAPTSRASRPTSSPRPPSAPPSSGASRPSRSRTSSRPCAAAAATWP